MTGQGGEIRPTIGNVTADSVIGSGTISIPGGLVVSGGANLQNVTGIFWRGLHFSGRAGGVGGGTISGTYLHLEKGFINIDMSGQKIWIPYWVSA